ncbi:UNVERIFIED_CONTAM: hypothetical protein PYX00_008404 [Menopon gallinae]|uniref:Uncharacterized protein n=1 Tax=Menopon gallinae TaxID=328185 RepID=A0AAW2HP71_9NEOP
MTMSEDASLNDGAKGRSASICAPGCSSMEALAITGQLPPSGSGTPDTGTPSGRRRRPAARSQSARVTGGKSIRRKAQNQDGALRTGSSEPRIDAPAIHSPTPEASPSIRRKGSSRKSLKQAPRKSTAFLDVPNFSAGPAEGEDEDSYRLRSFSFTSKGVVNRGDSFRRRRSRSNSLAPPGVLAQETPLPTVPATPQEVTSYRVAMVGAQGVGKTALISQFMTSECINAYDRSHYESNQNVVSIMLNGEESELHFENITNPKVQIDKSDPQDAFVILFSVIDKASFQRAEDELSRLVDMDLLRSRPAILVANKIDLARSRTISTQDGKCLACTFRAKYIEVSVGINHNVDELLVGILNQIRLKLAHAHLSDPESSSPQWYKSRGMVRASMKARQMFTWLFGKEDSKFKNCENLHVL